MGKRRILQPDEVSTVLEALCGSTLYPIVALAIATGARRGELLALEWCDVDLDKGLVRINKSLEETKRGLRVKPPKTASGRRIVTIPPDTASMLREHRRQQAELRLQLG
jgi:integrase